MNVAVREPKAAQRLKVVDCDIHPKSVRGRQFAIKVEPGSELVKGPYVAETFPVSFEVDYLVIDI